MSGRVFGWLYGLLAAALVLPLGASAFLGWFSRYGSDDFCTAGIAVTRGFVAAQAYWYLEWSGRFTFIALVTALEQLGSWTPRVLPALALVVWIAVGVWAMRPVGSALGWWDPSVARRPRWGPGWRPPLSGLVLAELIPFATLAAAPNIGQSFYWQTGLLTYTLPLILATGYVGWLARQVVGPGAQTHRGRRMLLSGAIGFGAGGLSETTVAVQTAALLMAIGLVLVWVRGRRRSVLLGLLGAAVIGSLVAAVVMLLAPGTGLRAAQEQDPGFSLARVPETVRASLVLAVWIVRRFEVLSRPTAVLIVVAPAVLGYLTTTQAAQARPASLGPGAVLKPVLITAAGYALLALSLFPVYMIQGFDPPARVQIVSDFVLVVALAALGYVLGELTGRVLVRRLARSVRLAAAAGLVLLLVAPFGEALNSLAQVPYEAEYASAWDQDDQAFRAAALEGAEVAVVAPLPPRWGWAFVDTRPGSFPNNCVARFYGLSQVMASGPAPVWAGAAEKGGRAPGA